MINMSVSNTGWAVSVFKKWMQLLMTPASLETGTGSVAHEGLFPALTSEQGSPEQQPRGDSGDIGCDWP